MPLFFAKRIYSDCSPSVVCCEEESREAFLKLIEQVNMDTLPDAVRMKEVPANCIAKLFPGRIWHDLNTAPWPKSCPNSSSSARTLLIRLR